MNIRTVSLLLLIFYCKVYCTAQTLSRKVVTNTMTDTIKTTKPLHNLISITPFGYYTNYCLMFNSSPIALVGLSYERTFRNERLNVRFPISVAISKPGFLFTPSVKFFPKKNGVIRYSVGPQFVASFVEESYEYIYGNFFTHGGPPVYQEIRFQYGLTLSNSLNFCISRKINISMEGNFGILFYDSFNNLVHHNREEYTKNTDAINYNTIFSTCVNIGYRF